MELELTCKIDSRGLTRGIEFAMPYTKRTLPEMVNTCAYWVAINAKQGMPFVTPEKIDAELGTIVTPIIGKRGKVLSQKYSRNKILSGGRMGDSVPTVPLTVLIIAARANPSSRYNQITNSRYALDRNPFKGVTRSAGRAAMKAMISRMIKARHSASKFLLAGWIPVIQKLLPYSVQRFMKGGLPPMDGKKNFYGADLGTATIAIAGGYQVSSRIENLVGMEGINGKNFNQALMLHGVQPLQAAVDREGNEQMNYALKKYEAELAVGVNHHWK